MFLKNLNSENENNNLLGNELNELKEDINDINIKDSVNKLAEDIKEPIQGAIISAKEKINAALDQLKNLNLKNRDIILISLFLTSLPIIFLNLSIYLFKDIILGSLIYLIFIYYIPIIFNKIFKIKWKYFIKGPNEYLNYISDLNDIKDKSSKTFYFIFSFILFLAILLIFFIFKFNLAFNWLLPQFDLKIINILISIFFFFLFIILIPLIENKFFFEFSYFIIKCKKLKNLFISLIFTLKYSLIFYYLSNSKTIIIISFLINFISYYLISSIYNGNNIKDSLWTVRFTNLMVFLLFFLVILWKISTVVFDKRNIINRFID